MRLSLIIAVALMLSLAALTALPSVAPGLSAAQPTDMSAAKKKAAKKAKKKDENLKAAPGTGPSGPTKY